MAGVIDRCSRAVDTARDLPHDKALEFAIHTLQGVTLDCTNTLGSIDQLHLVRSQVGEEAGTSHDASTSGGRPSAWSSWLTWWWTTQSTL